MGSRGPVPKRDAERRRYKSQATDTVAVEGQVAIPPADPKWHKIARSWYEALAVSGQSQFYEPSDWGTAYLIAESISRDLKPQAVGADPLTGKVIRARVPLRGASLAAYLKAMACLMVTEGDRRRASLEIRRSAKEPELASVSVMDEYRDMLGG